MLMILSSSHIPSCGHEGFIRQDDLMFAEPSSVIQHRAETGVFLHRCLCCNEPISPPGIIKVSSPVSTTGLAICCQELTAASHRVREEERESSDLRTASCRSESF